MTTINTIDEQWDTYDGVIGQLNKKDVVMAPTDRYFKIWLDEDDNLWYCSSKFEGATVVFKDVDQEKAVRKYNAYVRGEEYQDYSAPTQHGAYPIE